MKHLSAIRLSPSNAQNQERRRKKVDHSAVVRTLMSNISVIIISVVFCCRRRGLSPYTGYLAECGVWSTAPRVTLLQASCMIEVAFTV